MPGATGNRCGHCARFQRIRIEIEIFNRIIGLGLMKIEEAILYVLAERGGGLRTEQIAEIINRRRLHIRKDGQPVTSAQVYAVVMRYPDTFVKAEGRIMLMI